MKSKTYFGEYSLRHWLNLLMKCNITLPAYQRSFVWNAQDVERLVVSFRSGQFIQPVTIAYINSIHNGKNIILDEQQRLTSILLFAINLFPKKDKFKEMALLASDDDNVFDEEDSVTDSGILEWTFENLLKEDVAQNTLDNIKHRAFISNNYEILNLKNPLCVMTDEEKQKFLDNTFLGFSYIVPETAPAADEQRFFTTLFRNMNYLGKKLSVLESRKSLYYLNDNFKNYFEGRIADGSEALAGLKIMENVAPRNVDFVRYLAILSQFDGSNAKKVMVGYSSFAARESYYVDYVSYILGLEQEDRKDKFDKFNLQNTFGAVGWQSRFEKLKQTLTSLKDKMDLDKKFVDAFKSWIDADYWLFGLIYWVVFQGNDIDLYTDWSAEISRKVEKLKRDESYSKSPNLLKNLRIRIEDSVAIVKKHIK